MRALVAAVLVAVLFQVVRALIVPRVQTVQWRLASNKAGSYQEMLRRAQESKGVASVQRQQQETLEAPIPSLKGNRGGLPFSDEMYEHLKFAIEKLSARIKSDAALTPQELDKLRLAVDRIILDANIPNVAFASSSSEAERAASMQPSASPQAEYYKQPSPTSNRAAIYTDPDEEDGEMDNDDDDEVGADNAAAVFFHKPDDKVLPEWLQDIAGTKNSWNVPNMESMSTEEYYRTINSRLTEMKVKESPAPFAPHAPFPSLL